MKIIDKISIKLKENGLKGVFNSLSYHYNSLVTHISTYIYFLFHRNLSDGLYGDLLGWKSYISLKYKYSGLLDVFPKYNMVNKPSKVIWWCWFQGEDNAPDLCKSCLNSLRIFFPDYEINIITEENIDSYVKMPSYISEKFKNGCFSRTHFSDIIRVSLLAEYGGIWIDSTVFCTGRPDFIVNLPLFVFQDWKFNNELPAVASSWFISSYKGNSIVCATRDLLFEYWRNNDKLQNYFLFHHFFHLATDYYSNEWNEVPRYSNIPPHYMQFELFENYSEERFKQICQASDFHKLTYKDPRMREGVPGSVYNKLFLND